MFDNTRQAFAGLKRDIDIIKWITEYGTNVLTIIYLSFALIFNIGNFIANVALLIVCGLLLVINLVYGKKELSKKQKKIVKEKTKKAKNLLKLCKLVVKTYSLGVILYAMVFSNYTASPIYIIITTLMIIVWIINVMTELIKGIFNLERDRILRGLKEDFDWVEKTKNFANEQVEQIKQVSVQAVEQAKEKINDARTVVQKFFQKNSNENKKENWTI